MKITIFSLLYLFCLSHGVHAEQALSYNIVTQAKHNSASFTQGLTLDGDWLIESSGLRGKSFISIYHADSGAPKARWALPHQQFAEGLTLLNQKIYLLTWTSGVMHILDAASLKTVATKQFEGEGWGLTHDGTQFIMSDGSDKLTLRNTSDFAVTKKIQVGNGRQYYKFLNELEYANGSVWANVWQSNKILRINPGNGSVTGVLDLTELVERNNKIPGHTVLNGIAYDQKNDAFWVTGKQWPNRYLIKITEN